MIWLVDKGYNNSFDDHLYVEFASQIVNGTFNRLQSPYAYGWLLPLSVALPLHFGLSVSLAAQTEFILLILLIYLISLEVSKNDLIALAISVIAATSAFIVAYSSRVLPDMFSGLVIAAGIYAILKDRHPFFVGVVFGILAFIKLGSFSIVAIMLICLFIFKDWKYALWFLAGVLLMLSIYMWSMGFNWSIFTTYSNNQASITDGNLSTNFVTMFALIAPFLYLLKNEVYWQVFPLGLLLDFAFIGTYISYLKKENYYYLFSAFFILSFLYLMFGTESFHSWAFITIVSRYFILLTSAMAILASRFLLGIYDYVEYRYSQRSAILVLAMLVLMSILLQIPMLNYFHNWTPNFVGAPT